eukprot:TRINITY_DN6844_c0_g1_i1.p1 TRINITY_DN6844_c0_g1~~TRINITY_DN6844_c0_g1_i1.p1  ORF type:complete len:581 (+),score=165.93 TRINITY_DN6844_c0_g1_i1:367-2109(+)
MSRQGSSSSILLRAVRVLFPVVFVVALFFVGSQWGPGWSMLPDILGLGKKSFCKFDIYLGPSGRWEGSWNRDALTRQQGRFLSSRFSFFSTGVNDGMVNEDGAEISVEELVLQLEREGKQVAGQRGEAEEELERQLLIGLANVGSFNTSDPLTLAFARLVENSLGHWTNIPGLAVGLGSKGMVKPQVFHAMALNEKLAPCIGHVRVVEGHVFFRYGSFLDAKEKLVPMNLSIQLLMDAIQKYELKALKAEFFINVCSEPQSMDNSLAPGKAGFPMLSSFITSGSTDILIPDPLDLHGFAPHATQSKPEFSQMVEKAVFRGPQSNFELKNGNHGAAPRMRLHFMTDVRPDLLDARVTMWGPHDHEEARSALVSSGFLMGENMEEEMRRKYKYNIVVDEAVGSNEMCYSLASSQVTVRQTSPFSQFFDPLILPGVHFVKVSHSFDDLFETVEWMREHDLSMKRVVARANEAAQWVCTWESRTLYWAVLLSKYVARAMEDPAAVEAPLKICDSAALQEVEPKQLVKGWCRLKALDPCFNFCPNADEETWHWLSGTSLQGVDRTDPFSSSHIKAATDGAVALAA